MTVTGLASDLNAALNGMNFNPTADYAGTASVQITTDDQGNSGTGPAGIVNSTVDITVVGVNDAPALTPVAPLLTPLTEDDIANAGQTVASIVGASIADADPSAAAGVAITGVNNGNGSWQYSIDGGSTWNAVGSPSDTAALLLRATDLVRFVPDGRTGTSGELIYRAWDQTSGVAGGLADATINGDATAFSVAKDTATIDVWAINDAPVGGRRLLRGDRGYHHHGGRVPGCWRSTRRGRVSLGGPDRWHSKRHGDAQSRRCFSYTPLDITSADSFRYMATIGAQGSNEVIVQIDVGTVAILHRRSRWLAARGRRTSTPPGLHRGRPSTADRMRATYTPMPSRAERTPASSASPAISCASRTGFSTTRPSRAIR